MGLGGLLRQGPVLVGSGVGQQALQPGHLGLHGGDLAFQLLHPLFQGLLGLLAQAHLALFLFDFGAGAALASLLLFLGGAALLLHVVVVIAQVLLDAFRAHLQHPAAHPVDKVPVVGHGEDGAGEIVQGVLQHFPGVHVQVVGGLVQQQQVIPPQHQLGQGHPAPLAAGQGADGLEHVLSGKEEQGQHPPHVAGLHPGEIVPHLAHHRLFRVQALLLLVVVARVHVGAIDDDASVGLELAHQAAQQRGLADAVGADEGHPVPGPQVQVEIFEQGTALESLFQVLGDEHVVAGAAADIEGEAHLLLAHRPLHLGLLDALQLFFPAAGGDDGFLPVEAAVAGDDGLMPGDLRLLQLVFLHLPGQVFLPPGGEGVVIARVLGEPPHGQLRHGVAHLVEKIPVVADEQHGALVLLQRILQPGDGGQVQVVGGLVQHQKVGLGQQDSGQAQPGLFPAGEQAGGLVLPSLGKAQSGQHPLDQAGPLIAPLPLEALGQAGVFPVQRVQGLGVLVALGDLLLQMAQLGLQGLQGIEHPAQFLQHRPLAGDIRLLGQEPHRGAPEHRHRALVGLHLPGQNLEQGGFAAAVYPHQPHAAALLQGEVHFLEHLVHDEALADVLQ